MTKALNGSAALGWWKKSNKFYCLGWAASWKAVFKLRDKLGTSQKPQVIQRAAGMEVCWDTTGISVQHLCMCSSVHVCSPWCRRPGGAWQSTACYPEPTCLEESGWNPQLDSHGSEGNRGAVRDMFLNTFSVNLCFFNTYPPWYNQSNITFPPPQHKAAKQSQSQHSRFAPSEEKPGFQEPC